jgi:hypothetical protein
LRRAAEAAAENQVRDDRALQLAKAAAELAGALAPSPSSPPPGARPSSARQLVAGRPQVPQAAPSRPPPPLPARSPSKPPEPPARSGIAPAALRVEASGAFKRAPLAPRPARSAPPSEPTVARSMPARAPRPPASTPVVDESTPPVAAVLAASAVPAPPSSSDPVPAPSDSSPTLFRAAAEAAARALLEDDLSDGPEEKTRIGVPAYQAGAMAAAEPAAPAKVEDPSLRPCQAMRVIVWRAADGVHVAPQGTHVAAIAVDAVLVALDPAADLAAWLSKK